MNYLRLAEFKVHITNKINSINGFREMMSQTFEPEQYDLYLIKNEYYWQCVQILKKKLHLLDTALAGQWLLTDDDFKHTFNSLKYPKRPF